MASESRKTVLIALAANAGIGVVKLVAGLLSGSSAMLAEAAHSVADTTNQVFLLASLSFSEREPDEDHPFGYGKERFLWSFMAAIFIFVSGALFSFYQGIHELLSGEAESSGWGYTYVALGAAFVLEGASLIRALRQTRQDAGNARRPVGRYVRSSRDPTTKTVVFEDSAAVTGVVIAAVGVGLHQITGDSVYDGIASLIIGALLVTVAFLLARACRALLIGKQADPRLLRAIEKHLEEQEEVDDVVDMLTMLVGSGRVLLCVRADFVNSVSAGSVEQACSRVDASLREKFDELDEIFIQPVSKDDVGMRHRVEARYGHALADE